eukprot:11209714-Prorocentrum_lima.AAC.1
MVTGKKKLRWIRRKEPVGWMASSAVYRARSKTPGHVRWSQSQREWQKSPIRHISDTGDQ